MSFRSIASASRVLALAALVLGLTAAPGAALGKKRVVILNFEGKKTQRFQTQVRAIVKKRASLVSQKRYRRTARKLDANRLRAGDVKQVAQSLSVDGVISGTVKRRKGRYRLTVKVRAGVDGEVIAIVKATSRRRKITGKAFRAMRRELRAALRELPELVDEINPDEEESTDDTPPPTDVFADDTPPPTDVFADDTPTDESTAADAEIPPTRVAAAGAANSSGATVSASPSSEPASPSSLEDMARADRRARSRAADLMAGVAISQRQLSFDVAEDLGPNSPRGYSGVPVASAYAVGEVYPMAFFGGESFLDHIGVTFIVDRVVQIESRLAYNDANDMPQEISLPTQQARYGAGLVYRLNLGSTPTSPTLKIAVRYNKATFTIDRSEAPAEVDVDIPNTDTTYFDPGLALRYPLSRRIALRVDGRFLLVTHTGEMQQTDQYGGSTVLGADLDAGGELKLTSSLFLRAGLRATALSYDFEGTGEKTMDRDGNADDQDVFGATDRYLGGYFTAGYLF